MVMLVYFGFFPVRAYLVRHAIQGPCSRSTTRVTTSLFLFASGGVKQRRNPNSVIRSLTFPQSGRPK